MRVLVTGGAGYIGSHTCVELANAGHEVVILDNLSNSNHSVTQELKFLMGSKLNQFIIGNVCDPSILDWLFRTHKIDAVIHFAGLKAVGESCANPIAYYENNVGGTICLLEAMKKHNVKTLVFSSSACVYGSPKKVPIKETAKLSATNPYGRTKLMIEEILWDVQCADRIAVAVLRYFNPVGAHESGRIGDNPKVPNNLVPYIGQVAIGLKPKLAIFGTNWPTKDGTCVRDYVHVVDVAKGHIAALNTLENHKSITVNLGTGIGHSVMDVVRAFEKVSEVTIEFGIAGPRVGDVAECYADVKAAQKVLGWKAEKNLEQMCLDHWNFIKDR